MPTKITAPAGAIVNGPHKAQGDDPEDLYWVEGVLYTDNGTLIDWFTRKGYTVEPDETIPAEYTAAVARYRKETVATGRKDAVPLQAADGDYFNYQPQA